MQGAYARASKCAPGPRGFLDMFFYTRTIRPYWRSNLGALALSTLGSRSLARVRARLLGLDVNLVLSSGCSEHPLLALPLDGDEPVGDWPGSAWDRLDLLTVDQPLNVGVRG